MHISEEIEPLLYTNRTESAMIEFTRACNLKCTYCAVSQKHWKPTTLDFSKVSFQDILQSLTKRKTKTAIIHGHGETTIVKGWENYAKQIKDKGIGLVTCTNLAKKYTESELELLAEFVGLTVSLDTLDPDLFRRLRRNGEISVVLANQAEIQKRALAKGNKITWVWSIVVIDLTIDGLFDLVKKGVEMGVQTFCLCNLTEMPTPEGGTPVRHLNKLPKPKARKAMDILNRIEQLCKANNRVFDPKAGLIETLKRTLEQS